MNRDEKRRRILRLCKEMQENADALGRFSDHEGTTDGPTWIAFKEGYLAPRALQAIRLHNQAIHLWHTLYNLVRTEAPRMK